MKREKFITYVVSEIEDIKVNFTDKEKDKLDFETFCPDSGNKCIYGQATGACRSKRAMQLIKKCCNLLVQSHVTDTFREIKNSNFIEFSRKEIKELHYFSTLETYILFKHAKSKAIIEYIKGKRDSLPQL